MEAESEALAKLIATETGNALRTQRTRSRVLAESLRLFNELGEARLKDLEDRLERLYPKYRRAIVELLRTGDRSVQQLAETVASQLPFLGHLPAQAGHHVRDDHRDSEEQRGGGACERRRSLDAGVGGGERRGGAGGRHPRGRAPASSCQTPTERWCAFCARCIRRKRR